MVYYSTYNDYVIKSNIPTYNYSSIDNYMKLYDTRNSINPHISNQYMNYKNKVGLALNLMDKYDNDFHEFSNAVGNIVGEHVNSSIITNIAGKTNKGFEYAKTIGSISSCNYDKKSWLKDHNLFTIENNQRAESYCAQLGFDSTYGSYLALTPSLENARLHRIDYLQSLSNEKIFNLTSTNANNGFIDDITLNVYELNYKLNELLGDRIYRPFNDTINAPGHYVGDIVTNGMNHVHDGFIKVENQVEFDINQYTKKSFYDNIDIGSFFNFDQTPVPIGPMLDSDTTNIRKPFVDIDFNFDQTPVPFGPMLDSDATNIRKPFVDIDFNFDQTPVPMGPFLNPDTNIPIIDINNGWLRYMGFDDKGIRFNYKFNQSNGVDLHWNPLQLANDFKHWSDLTNINVGYNFNGTYLGYNFNPFKGRERYFSITGYMNGASGDGWIASGTPLVFFDNNRTVNIDGSKFEINVEQHWNYKKGFYKKIYYDNDFFDIYLRSTGKHTKDAIEAFKQEYVQQMGIKCYQVLGIPYDTLVRSQNKDDSKKSNTEILDKTLNNVFEKYFNKKGKNIKIFDKTFNKKVHVNDPSKISRYEKAVLNKRDGILFEEWCEVNKITEHDKQLYFMPRTDSSKSFYDRNKHLNPIDFVKEYLNKDYYDTIEYIKLHNPEAAKNICPTEVIVSDKEREDFYKGKKNDRTDEDNARLEDTRQTVMNEASSHQGRFTRSNIIYDVNKSLINYDISVENFVNTASSSLFSLGVGSLVYLDKDIEYIKNNGLFSYVGSKSSQFGKNYASIYGTQVIANHTTTTIGFCKFADNWSDEFLSGVVAPNIYCSVGMAASIGRLAFDSELSKSLNEGEKIKMVTENFFIVNSKYIVQMLDSVKYAFSDSQIQLVTQNIDLFSTFLTAHNLLWMLPLGKAIIIGLFIRFIGYLMTKDKCNVDIVAFKDQVKKNNRVNKMKKSIKLLSDPNISQINKEIVYEEMIRSNMILRETPKKFKFI